MQKTDHEIVAESADRLEHFADSLREAYEIPCDGNSAAWAKKAEVVDYATRDLLDYAQRESLSDSASEEVRQYMKRLYAGVLGRYRQLCFRPGAGFVYFVLAPHSLAVKIGFTKDHPARRLCELQVGTPEPLVLIGYGTGDELEESMLHRRFRRDHLRGEWFKLTADLRRFIIEACSNCPAEILLQAPEFSESLWNCDPTPKGLPSTPREIESWTKSPKLYR